jgi:hypothetical protein
MRATREMITAQFELAEQLLEGRGRMCEPQDLPGRYGRMVKALDHLLEEVGCEAVVGGGWAVWRHGFHGRLTQDIDIALAADRVDEFLRAASVGGFDVLPQHSSRLPKVLHRETGIKVDLLPEGQRPGTPARPAPTTLPHPSAMCASGHALRYMTLAALIELKLGAGRGRDESDVIELIRANPEQITELRQHLAAVHANYLIAFDRLADRARDQRDE